MKNNSNRDKIDWQQVKLDVAIEAVKAFAPMSAKNHYWTPMRIAEDSVKLAEYFMFYFQKSQQEGLVIRTSHSEK